MSFFAKTNRRAILALLLSAVTCGMSVPLSYGQDKDKDTITLGIMDGDEANAWQVAVKEAEKQGFHIKLVKFSDYAIPNEALASGDLDANAIQHKPYFDAQVAQRGYKLTVIGYTALFPMGVYSRKIKNLSELRDGAEIGIPNDPSNEGRALRILAQRGIITLKNPDDILVTPFDIKDNPKKLKFREMDAGVVGRALDDLDVGIVNNTWITSAGLDPDKERIDREQPENNPYNNIIAVRPEDVDKPWVKKLLAAYQNDAVRAELERTFGSGFATSW